MRTSSPTDSFKFYYKKTSPNQSKQSLHHKRGNLPKKQIDIIELGYKLINNRKLHKLLFIPYGTLTRKPCISPLLLIVVIKHGHYLLLLLLLLLYRQHPDHALIRLRTVRLPVLPVLGHTVPAGRQLRSGGRHIQI